jgi:hypothetical protein
MQALADVVQEGRFRQLRGLSLWKLTTRAEHRSIEPFAAVLQPDRSYSPTGWPDLPDDRVDALDRAYIGLAASIADDAATRMASWSRRD